MMEQITLLDDKINSNDVESTRTMLFESLSDTRYHYYMSIQKNLSGEIIVKANNSIVCIIKISKKTKYLAIPTKQKEFFQGCSFIKEIRGMSRIEIYSFNDIQIYVEKISKLYIKILTDSAEEFGCCHRYILCSDEKKCIHFDYLFALGCMYRKNLELGKIFYGKNRNID
jgi:hypothetical protein